MAKGNKKALRRAKKREVVKLQKWNRVWENHAADDTNGTHDQWQLDMYEGARTFHQFGQLPAEIRIMILTLAALEGRHLVCVHMFLSCQRVLMLCRNCV